MENNNTVNSWQSSVELKEYWALSNQIIELASKGYSRPQFLKDVIQLLLRITGCDVIGLVFRDRGRQFACRGGNGDHHSFRFEQISLSNSGNGKTRWSCGENEALENLCRDIINRRFDPQKPWFTKNGSFWTGDIDEQSLFGELPSEEMKSLAIEVNREFKSVALIPIDIGHERVGLLELQSRERGFFDDHRVDLFEQMGRTIGNALTHRRIHIAIRERVKELTCLYGIAKLVQRPNITLDIILQEAVNLLPPAWLFPEIASAQIVFDDQVFISSNLGKVVHRMRADLIVDDNKRGHVEIRYSEEKPALDEGPFLREERKLIETIAQELSIIIEQFQVEEKNIVLQEQLLHSDRLATIGQLVAGVAHELNEPLANILGFAQLAIKAPELPGQVKSDLDKIVVSSLHARDVIQKLLLSARGTPPAKESVKINDLITDGLTFLTSRCAKSGIELICELDPDLPILTADRSQLIQVLTNLVVNAIQAMPFGGRLKITTASDNGNLVISVADSGIGMDEKVMAKIFDAFYTTKDSDQGTGLGLTIVKNIVSAHGGTIEVRSELGAGTEFTVRLPKPAADR